MHSRAGMHRLGRGVAAASVAALAACTTPKPTPVEGAVTAPLSDLNIVRVAIPPVLQAAQARPYAMPEDSSCEALAAQVVALDEELGPDIDSPSAKSDPLSVARVESEAGDAAVGALRRTAEGVVPFRSWVRKLTGAERHTKEVAAAIAAGSARRAFLKGVRLARDCK